MLLNTNMNLRMGFEDLAANVLQPVDISNIILLPPAVALIVEAALQTKSSRIRFTIVSLEFFNDSASDRNEYLEYFLGGGG